MRDGFTEQINHYFDDPVLPIHEDKSKTADSDEFSELGLVDIQDFEDSLSLDRMIKIGETKYAAQLECLIIRYAELGTMDPLQTRLPIHVAQICRGFRATLENRDIPQDIIAEIYSFFSERVVRNLDALYTSLNAYLRDQGICPNIEEQVKKLGSVLKAKRDKRAESSPPKPKPERVPEPDPEAPPEPRVSPRAAQASGAAPRSAPAENQDFLVEQAKRGGFDFSDKRYRNAGTFAQFSHPLT